MRSIIINGVFLCFVLTASSPAYGEGASAECGTKRCSAAISVRAVVSTSPAESDSLEFAGFSRALEKIFSAEKIQSILSKLPSNCKIYGFDVGDFSGDDGMDVVLSTRQIDARSRDLHVHFFINEGPAFAYVQTLSRRFVIEPIEVGFSIERGAAYVTEKTGDFGWRITGYAVRDQIFRRVYEWQTDRMPYRGRETEVGWDRARDYKSHLVDEHYFGVNSKRSFLRQKYYDLPLFPSDAKLPASVSRQIGDSTALMIVRGGSSWHGPDDCSIAVSGSYDSSQVVLLLHVHDDRLLYSTDPDSSDYAALYFDLSRKTRLRPGGSTQTFSPNTQFGLVVLMGDGETHGPVVELHGAKLAKQHRAAISVNMRRDKLEYQLYHFTIVLPRAMFADGEALPPAGFAAVYHDVDYPANLGWVSLAATSRGYEEHRPETYGRLHFVSDMRNEWEWDNLATRALAISLRRAGVLP